jgi:hypothetical protein
VLRKLFLTVACTFIPFVAFGQSVLPADGCIAGFPCTARLLRPADDPAYRVAGYDCAVDQREPCRWHNDLDTTSGNVYQTRRNADGTTDVSGSNAKTGSTWDQHYDPSRGFQSGHRKNGQPWTGRLVAPFGNAHNGGYVYADRFAQEENQNYADIEPPTPSITEAEPQAIHDEYARELAERQREAEQERETLINRALAMSRMQPGVLAAAARAAARQRCVGVTDANARDACAKTADRN